MLEFILFAVLVFTLAAFVWLLIVMTSLRFLPPKWCVWIFPEFLLQHPVSGKWDVKLNALLDSDEPIVFVDEYTVRIGETEIWTSNFPYASFNEWSPTTGNNRLSPTKKPESK
jgi:hypothetical protein